MVNTNDASEAKTLVRNGHTGAKVLARLQQLSSLCCHQPLCKLPPPASPCKREHSHLSTQTGVTKTWHPFWGRLLTLQTLCKTHTDIYVSGKVWGKWPKPFWKMFIKKKPELWGRAEGKVEEETSPLYHSVDAISLTTYKGWKGGRNTGNGARRKNKERRMV